MKDKQKTERKALGISVGVVECIYGNGLQMCYCETV